MDRTTEAGATRRRARYAGPSAAVILGVVGAALSAGAARADPGRIYCFVPAQFIYEYKGVTNEPTESTLISPNGSFSDGQDWNGAYSSIDTDSGVCLGKLPPGPKDNLVVGTVSNGTNFLSTTIGGGGGSYASLFGSGQPPKSGVTLTLDTDGSKFTTFVTMEAGVVSFNGGLSAGTAFNLTNIDLQNPAKYTLAGGTYSAGTEIFISGQAEVTAPSSATLRAPEVHLGGGADLELGGKLMAASFLTVGEAGFGRLNIQSGAAVTSGNGFIGAFAGSNGSVIVNGKWTTTGELIDGQLGHGALTVGEGGQVTTGDFMTVGAGVGLSTLDITGGGQVSVTPVSKKPTDLALNTAVDPASIAMVTVSGAGSKLNINGALNVGYLGTATMNVTTGAAVTVNGSIVRVGRMAGATGTLNLTGGNSTFTFAKGSTFDVGTFGTGNLNVTGGFQLDTGNATVTLGSQPGSNGTALVSDLGSLWIVGSSGGALIVGGLGHGSLTVSNGGDLDLSDSALLELGQTKSGIGDLTLSGATSSIRLPTASTSFIVGDGGHGNLVLNQGFALDTGGAAVTLGADSDGVGFASVSGAGTSWNIGGDLTVGGEGKGELDVTGGAALTIGGADVSIGNTPQGGKLLLSGSGALTLKNTIFFEVGNSSDGVGTLLVNQGFDLDTGKLAQVYIGVREQDLGFVDLSDQGTTWTVGSTLIVGGGGHGGLDIENGASLILQSGASLQLGLLPTSAGILVLDGASSSLSATSAQVQIGVEGAGELDIQNAATLDWSAQSVVLGAQAGSLGTIQVLSGGTFNVKNLTLGQAGSGELDVGDSSSKGTLNVLGTMQVATGAAPGDVTIDGGSKATFSGDVTFGSASGDATLKLDNASSVLMKGNLSVSAAGSSTSAVSVLGGSNLTVKGQFFLGSFSAHGSLNIDNASTVEVDNGFTVTGANMSVTNGSTFNSTSSTIASFTPASDMVTLAVMSGSHMTLAGGLIASALLPVSFTVDGDGSTLTADALSSFTGVGSSLTISGSAQVSLTANLCKCTALTWSNGSITVSGGAVLTAPSADIGSSSMGSASLTLSSSGAAAFTRSLKLEPGSTLDVTGGGDLVVGAAAPGLGAGQISIDPGGTLKGVAGGAPPIINGGFNIQPGVVVNGISRPAGLVSGTFVINGKVQNFGKQVLGDDPSTVTVNGAYTLGSTGIIVAEIGPTSYSKLIVNGPVVLDGGTLEFEPVQGGMFKIGTTYNVLTASGGVTGAFADVTVAQPAGMPFLQLSSDFVDGTLEVTALHMPGSFASVAATPNDHAVARTLDRAAPTATGTLGDFINVLSNSDTATVQADFEPLSGAAYGAFAQAGMQANRDFAAALRGAAAQTSGREGALVAFEAPRQSLSANGAGGDPSVWMTAIGGIDHADGVDGARSVRTNAGGVAGGVDLSPAPHWAVGGAFGYVHTDLGAGPEGSGGFATYQGALYGGYAGARLYVDASAGYAQSNGSLQRSLAPAATLSADGQVRADQYFASGEAGLDLGRWNGATLTPFAALDAVSYQQAAFTETGAAGLGLAVDGRRTDSVRSELGVQVSTTQIAASPFEASFRLGWGHEFADAARPVTGAFIGAPDLPFTVEGAPQARDFAAVGVGVGARLKSGVSFTARYDANLSTRTSEQLLSLNARFAW